MGTSTMPTPANPDDRQLKLLELTSRINMGWVLLGVLLTRWSNRRIVAAWPRYEKEDLLFIKRLLETGEYRAVIDRTYPLEDVAEAHRYVDTWQKTGSVVLTVSANGKEAS